jgi:hypothetical protein
MSPLTPVETRFMELMQSKRSDRAVCAAMGISLDEAHTLAFSIRSKLGLNPGDSLRKAGK